jgi:phosphomannomutase
MITASHLPYNRNGFKFFDKKAGFEKKEITELLSRASKDSAQGSLDEDPSFPTDMRQSEASEVTKLEKILKLDNSLVSKVPYIFCCYGSLADGMLRGMSKLTRRTSRCHRQDRLMITSAHIGPIQKFASGMGM